MKHKRNNTPRSTMRHLIVSVPSTGVQPTVAYKARIQSVKVVGPKVVFEWAIFKGGKGK